MNPRTRYLVVAAAASAVGLLAIWLADAPAAWAKSGHAAAEQRAKAAADNPRRGPLPVHNAGPRGGGRRDVGGNSQAVREPARGIGGRGGARRDFEGNVAVPRRRDGPLTIVPRSNPAPRVTSGQPRSTQRRVRDPRDIAQRNRETGTRDITRRRSERLRDRQREDGPVYVVPVHPYGYGYGYGPWSYNPYAYGRGGYVDEGNDDDDFEEEILVEADARVRAAERRAARAERRAEQAEREAAAARRRAQQAEEPDLDEALAADPAWLEASAEVKAAREAYNAARRRVLDDLKANDPEYRQALAVKEQAERRLKALRGPDGNAEPELLTPAATASMEAGKALTGLEEAALAADAEVVAAREQLDAALARRNAARQAVEEGLPDGAQ